VHVCVCVVYLKMNFENETIKGNVVR